MNLVFKILNGIADELYWGAVASTAREAEMYPWGFDTEKE